MALESFDEKLKKSQVVRFTEPVPTRKVSLVYLRSMTKRSLIDAVQTVITEHLPSGVWARPESKIKVLYPEASHFEGKN